VASIICATRSPILGGAIFLVVYAAGRPRHWLWPILFVGGAFAYFFGETVIEFFQAVQPRVVRTDDGSATAREALFSYGAILFFGNPLGYGFAFNPNDHFAQYWQQLSTLSNPDSVKTAELHNYILNMLNVYGVGLILVAPLIYRCLVRAGANILFFIPYIVHIMFHNSGPFWNDLLFWIAVSILSAANLQQELN
jgi:hypothetical protein